MTYPSFTIEVGALLKAVTAVRGATDKSSTVPVLSHILIACSSGQIALTATDMEITVTKTIKAEVAASGIALVPADMLHSTLSRLPAASPLSVESGAADVILRCGRSRVTIKTLDARDYPNIRVDELGRSIEMSVALLKSALARASICIDISQTRPHMSGVYFYVHEDGAARFVSTDGVALCEIATPIGDAEFPSIIIPRKAIGQIRSRLDNETADTVTIEASETVARVTFSDTVLVTKLVFGAFPDYKRIVPRASEHPLRVMAGPLRSAVALVSGVSGNEKIRPVIIQAADGVMTMTSTASDRGDAVAELADGDVNQDVGHSADVALNGRYLDDILAHVVGDAELHISDRHDPVLVRDTGDGSVIYVLCAVRY